MAGGFAKNAALAGLALLAAAGERRSPGGSGEDRRELRSGSQTQQYRRRFRRVDQGPAGPNAGLRSSSSERARTASATRGMALRLIYTSRQRTRPMAGGGCGCKIWTQANIARSASGCGATPAWGSPALSRSN